MEFKDTIKKMVNNENDKRVARHLLKTRSKNKLSPVIFDAVLGTIPGTSLEVVPLNKSEDGTLKVFLTQRSPKDKYWPGEWHCPGTVVLNRDQSDKNDLQKPWDRLKKEEFMRESLSNPVGVSEKLLDTRRGKEIALIHYVEVPSDLEGGRYFDINELPDDLVPHHRIIINEAVVKYKEQHAD